MTRESQTLRIPIKIKITFTAKTPLLQTRSKTTAKRRRPARREIRFRPRSFRFNPRAPPWLKMWDMYSLKKISRRRQESGSNPTQKSLLSGRSLGSRTVRRRCCPLRFSGKLLRTMATCLRSDSGKIRECILEPSNTCLTPSSSSWKTCQCRGSK